MPMLITGKVDVREKSITRDKVGLFNDKRVNHQEKGTILNVYAPNNRSSKHRPSR